jgi:hypothetical protein
MVSDKVEEKLFDVSMYKKVATTDGPLTISDVRTTPNPPRPSNRKAMTTDGPIDDV